MKSVYYLANHPTDVVLYSDFCRFLHRHLPEVSQTLIVATHPYFRRFDCSSFFEMFDKVINLPAAGYHVRPKAFFSNIGYKRRVARLDFNDDSLVVTHALTHTELTINLLLRRIQQTTNGARVLTLDVSPFYRTMPRPTRTNDWRARAGYAQAVALLGAYPMFGQFRTGQLVHQVYEHEETIIDQHVVLSDHFESCPDYVTVKHPINPAIPAENADVDERRIGSASSYVFFFGNQRIFDFYPEVSRDSLVNLTNTFLAKLTKLYANTGVRLLYKMHPFEMDQAILFDLSGFHRFDKPLSSEMIYSLYRERIRAVYSLGSTSATTASLYGIPSFTFFEMLPFSPSTHALFERYLLSASRVVSVRGLNELKVEEPHPSVVFNDNDAGHLLDVLCGRKSSSSLHGREI
jgi:predicted metallopeptidase